MKKSIRKEILEKRKSLSPKEIILKSQEIFHRLKELPLYSKAQAVMVYVDFQNEVKTDRIIEDLISKGKKAIVPICIPATREMILSQILDPEEELTEGTYGILEPKKEYIRKVDAGILDLILVPGVAFDPKGYRIGYGGGYYDRFFHSLTKTIPSIAIAFDLQIIDMVPRDDFDLPVDYIVTETRTIPCIHSRMNF